MVDFAGSSKTGVAPATLKPPPAPLRFMLNAVKGCDMSDSFSKTGTVPVGSATLLANAICGFPREIWKAASASDGVNMLRTPVVALPALIFVIVTGGVGPTAGLVTAKP